MVPCGVACAEGFRNQWSCYFAPETSTACRRRALSMLRAKGMSNLKRKGVGAEMKVLSERKRWPLLWEPAPRSARRPSLPCIYDTMLPSSVQYSTTQ